jgi:chemotaxis protein histidine kinase CheA
MHRDDIEARLQQLRADYARRLPERLARIVAQWEALCRSAPAPANFDDLLRAFHTLAGSGTSFGFPEVTRLARELEQRLQAIGPDRPPTTAEKTAIDSLLNALCEIAGPLPVPP